MEIEVYSQSINRGVIKMPSQSVPGILLQGGTLSTLLKIAISIQEKSQNRSDPELLDLSAQLRDSLQELVSHYESTLGKHNIPLPYSTIPK